MKKEDRACWLRPIRHFHLCDDRHSQISTGTHALLGENSFSPTRLEIRPRLVPSTSFLISYSVIILQFSVIW